MAGDFLIAMKTLDAGRLGLGAACLGVAKELLEFSTKYAKEREQFDHPISIFRQCSLCLQRWRNDLQYGINCLPNSS